MNVCRLRDTPIIGFVNKLDRDIRDPIELLDEICQRASARVYDEAEAAGRGLAEGVSMYIQYGSEGVRDRSKAQGYDDLFRRMGVTMIEPGCGACIGCGPGVSETAEQVTVSAINRNFQGRSGPGQLYLASPLTVAASAVAGHITAFASGMFQTTPEEVASSASPNQEDQ